VLSNAGVYAIRLKGTRRAYIGSSIDVKARVRRHRKMLSENRHSNRHLQSAWNKYGSERFVSELVKRCKKESVLFWEQRYINQYRSCECGFNLAPLASSNGGVKYSAKAIAKLKASWTTERKAAMSVFTSAQATAQWASLTGRQRQRMLKSMDRTGYRHTAAAREKMVAHWTSMTGKQRRMRLKNIDFTGRLHTEATKKKMSAAAKRRWAHFHEQRAA